MVRATPRSDAVAVSQILHGETFEILDRAGEWAWGQSAHDGYVGYASIASFGTAAVPTHRVTVREAPVFAAPDIKSLAVARWSLGSVFAGEEADGFLRTHLGYVHPRHAQPIGSQPFDPVEVASRLIGAPYLWGGRGAGGIDCSGLVQLALAFAGINAPRDSDQQRALGEAIADGDPLRRGDLVFFPGHVGLMMDADAMIHANAYWMAVTIEPLADVVARLAPENDQPILARRRVAW